MSAAIERVLPWDYGWMEPKKKRRPLFRTEEYEQAETIEEAYWMARQETKWCFWLP